MTVHRILDGLERCDATGPEADAIARLGFLEWVFGYPEQITGQVVSQTLAQSCVQNPSSEAARAFVGQLREARSVSGSVPARRGRHQRRLH